MAAIKTLPTGANKHTFCPGCGHGIVNRLIRECIEELGYQDNYCFALAVGCSCNLHSQKGDFFQAAHGRAGAAATGIKRTRPDMLVIAYQGDGDAGVIGLAETLNAAYRNENLSVIIINNTNFGMTGGKMSWTTMPGEVTTTSTAGRNCDYNGYPQHLPEMIANSFSHIAYSARGSVADVKHIMETKKMIKKALQNQIDKAGYSIVEVLSPCPTNWHLDPLKSCDRIENELYPEYPLGEFKTREDK